MVQEGSPGTLLGRLKDLDQGQFSSMLLLASVGRGQLQCSTSRGMGKEDAASRSQDCSCLTGSSNSNVCVLWFDCEKSSYR